MRTSSPVKAMGCRVAAGGSKILAEPAFGEPNRKAGAGPRRNAMTGCALEPGLSAGAPPVAPSTPSRRTGSPVAVHRHLRRTCGILEAAGVSQVQESVCRVLVMSGQATDDVARRAETTEANSARTLDALVNMGLARHTDGSPGCSVPADGVLLPLNKNAQALDFAQTEVARLIESHSETVRRHDAGQLVEVITGARHCASTRSRSRPTHGRGAWDLQSPARDHTVRQQRGGVRDPGPGRLLLSPAQAGSNLLSALVSPWRATGRTAVPLHPADASGPSPVLWQGGRGRHHTAVTDRQQAPVPARRRNDRQRRSAPWA